MTINDHKFLVGQTLTKKSGFVLFTSQLTKAILERAKNH